MKEKNSARAWIVVAILTLMSCVGFGFVYNSASLYIGPVCESFGIGRTQYGFITSTATISGFLVSFFLGKMVVFFKKVRRILLLGMIAGICYLLLFYLAGNIYVLYFAGILRGVFTSSTSVGCVSVLLSKWFTEKRATAIGITAAGMGFGGILITPFVGNIISIYGWKTASLLSAGIVAAVVFPALFFLGDAPGENGEPESAAASPRESDESLKMDAKNVVHTPFFWLSVFGCVLLSTSISTILTNVADILGKSRLDPASIPIVISVLFLSSTAAKAIIGVFLDLLGVRSTMVIGMSCYFIAAACVLRAENFAIAIVFALFYGVGHSTAFTPMTTLVDKLFGAENYSTFIGYFFAALEVGFAVSPIINGLSVDLTGSYNLAIYISMVVGAVCLTLLLSAMRLAEKQGHNLGRPVR